MDFFNFNEEVSLVKNEETFSNSSDNTLEEEAYMSISTEDEKVTDFFNKQMNKETVASDCCMDTVNISFSGCDESVTFDAGKVEVCSSGTILKIDITLHDVCPDKRVALAVVLTEVDAHGKEHSRGMKTLTVPAHHHKCSEDIKVNCIRFVLPDDLDVRGEEKDKCKEKCKKRYFKARVMTNYVDNNFICHDVAL